MASNLLVKTAGATIEEKPRMFDGGFKVSPIATEVMMKMKESTAY